MLIPDYPEDNLAAGLRSVDDPRKSFTYYEYSKALPFVAISHRLRIFLSRLMGAIYTGRETVVNAPEMTAHQMTQSSHQSGHRRPRRGQHVF